MINTILKNARQKRGLNQTELADKLSISRSTISSYECGNSQPDFETIVKILHICGYDLKIYDKNNKEVFDIKSFSREF